MPTLVVSALSTFDNKGLKKGKKEVSAFEKQVKSFGKVFAGVFSATALLNYSKKAVAAFAADQKAAKSLELQLKNTGYAFSSPAVEDYIGKLQKTTGVLDDELRPSFQRLLTVTKSITQSQDALALALDLSAAGYGSVEEISSTLAKAYAGQTTALGKLNTGLSKSLLKTGDMNKIMGQLQQKFAGQAQARLTTYAGKMDLLKVASENVKEEIGKGILGALDALSKDTSIEDTTTKMENFGKSTGEAITGVGLLLAELEKIPGSRKVTDILFGTNIFSLLGKLEEIDAKSKAGTKANLEPRSASRVYLQQLRLESKIVKDLNKQRAAELAALKAKSEVDKLKDKFDIERIGYTLALNQATDAETKLRLQAKIAILDENEALAKKLNAELDATAKLKTLSDALVQAGQAALYFKDWANYRSGERGDASVLSNTSGGGGAAPMTMPSAVLNTQNADWAAYRAGERGDVVVNVAGSVLTEQDLTNTINETLLRINKMGRGTTPAGGLSGGT